MQSLNLGCYSPFTSSNSRRLCLSQALWCLLLPHLFCLHELPMSGSSTQPSLWVTKLPPPPPPLSWPSLLGKLVHSAAPSSSLPTQCTRQAPPRPLAMGLGLRVRGPPWVPRARLAEAAACVEGEAGAINPDPIHLTPPCLERVQPGHLAMVKFQDFQSRALFPNEI